jgi:hypothetical protein
MAVTQQFATADAEHDWLIDCSAADVLCALCCATLFVCWHQQNITYPRLPFIAASAASAAAHHDMRSMALRSGCEPTSWQVATIPVKCAAARNMSSNGTCTKL